MDHCAECGFVYGDLPRAQIPRAVREVAAQYPPRLGAHPAALRHHDAPGVWSPLEYAAHVRDVLWIQRERTMVALLHDAPTFTSMRAEERVSEDRYNDQDPVAVGQQIVGAADALASLLESLTDTEWERIGVYNWPVRSIRDIEWIARHTVHEEVHHLFDVMRRLQDQPGTPVGLGSG